MQGFVDKMEGEAKGIISTFSPLTKSPISEVIMAQTSLPFSISLDKISPKPTAHGFIDLDGQSFGRLTVLGYAGLMKNKGRWWVQCVCGVIKNVDASMLRRGECLSCGCFRRERVTRHGECVNYSISPEYRAYRHAIERCQRPNTSQYSNYGGRGVEFRFTSFSEFLAEIGRRPTPKHTLERVDNDGHYEKGNVKWATKRDQQNNRRNSKRIQFEGINITISQWARLLGINEQRLRQRLSKGMSFVTAVTMPLYQKKWKTK